MPSPRSPGPRPLRPPADVSLGQGGGFGAAFGGWLGTLPAQVAVLVIQIAWAASLEALLAAAAVVTEGGGSSGGEAAQAALDAKLVVWISTLRRTGRKEHTENS